jgi:hypothetical protein
VNQRSFVVAAWLGALAIALGGCTFNRAQINQADMAQRMAGVVPGQTTIAEVEAMAGSSPTSITPLGDGKSLYAYTFGDSKTAALFLILLNISKTNAGFDTALFLVDENGVVEWSGVGQNSKDLPWQWWAFGD